MTPFIVFVPRLPRFWGLLGSHVTVYFLHKIPDPGFHCWKRRKSHQNEIPDSGFQKWPRRKTHPNLLQHIAKNFLVHDHHLSLSEKRRSPSYIIVRSSPHLFHSSSFCLVKMISDDDDAEEDLLIVVTVYLRHLEFKSSGCAAPVGTFPPLHNFLFVRKCLLMSWGSRVNVSPVLSWYRFATAAHCSAPIGRMLSTTVTRISFL